jgi:predicted transcriptional regulator
MDNEAATSENVLGVSTAIDPVIDLTGGIASAYLSQNHCSITELPNLISTIHSALLGLTGGAATVAEPVVETETKTPSEIKKSITPDALVSFLDGKKYKTLKRHLSGHGLTPDTYRTKFGLPVDYPMVAPSYSAQRSALAKASGLGARPEAAAA